jgi:hypothetical protein
VQDQLEEVFSIFKGGRSMEAGTTNGAGPEAACARADGLEAAPIVPPVTAAAAEAAVAADHPTAAAFSALAQIVADYDVVCQALLDVLEHGGLLGAEQRELIIDPLRHRARGAVGELARGYRAEEAVGPVGAAGSGASVSVGRAGPPGRRLAVLDEASDAVFPLEPLHRRTRRPRPARTRF